MYALTFAKFLALTSGQEVACDVAGNCGTEQTAMLQKHSRGGAQSSLTEGAQIASREQHREAQTAQSVDASATLSALMEASAKMLRTGATPDVLKFTEDTLEEIRNNLIPTMEDAHKANQLMISEAIAAFRPIGDTFRSRVNNSAVLKAQEQRLQEDHAKCREQQRAACGEANAAEAARQQLWQNYTDQNADFASISDIVSKTFCEVGAQQASARIGTGMMSLGAKALESRHLLAARFADYIQEGQEYHEDRKAYEAKQSVRVEKNATQGKNQQLCDSLKINFEVAACARYAHGVVTAETLTSAWKLCSDGLAAIVADVKAMESDRKAQFTALDNVHCLLDKIYERGGKPCDEATEKGAADREIDGCHSQVVNTTRFNLD